jgi:hypothetical protein
MVVTRLVEVKGRFSLCLVLMGTVTIVTGVIIAVALLVRRGDCDGLSSPTVCRGYTNSLHWAFPLVALGAICFFTAGLSATDFVQRRGRKSGSEGPTDPTGRQTSD